jgi:hypothetical protein
VLAYACVCVQFCVGGSNNCFFAAGGKGGGAGWGLVRSDVCVVAFSAQLLLGLSPPHVARCTNGFCSSADSSAALAPAAGTGIRRLPPLRATRRLPLLWKHGHPPVGRLSAHPQVAASLQALAPSFFGGTGTQLLWRHWHPQFRLPVRSDAPGTVAAQSGDEFFSP